METNTKATFDSLIVKAMGYTTMPTMEDNTEDPGKMATNMEKTYKLISKTEINTKVRSSTTSLKAVMDTINGVTQEILSTPSL